MRRDDLAVARKLRSAFQPNTFGTRVTELTIGVLAADGPLPLTRLATRVHQLLGHGWRLDGQPLTAQDLRTAIGQQSPIMQGLDRINTSRRAWTVGPSTQSLLPGATMLAEIWIQDQ